MNDLQVDVLFNSITVILGLWAGGNERLCAMDLFRFEKISPCGSNSGPLDK